MVSLFAENDSDIYGNDREREDDCNRKLITSYIPIANTILAVWYVRKWIMIAIKVAITTIKKLSW